LIKLYYPETESVALQEWVRTENQQILYTSLHELELKNAFALKVFRNELTQEAYGQLIRTLNSDVQKSVLRRVHPKWGHVFRQSLEISDRNTPQVGSRSLDVLHVGIAHTLGCERFMSFDDRQSRLAQRINLTIVSIG
jgi:hypothetical protein